MTGPEKLVAELRELEFDAEIVKGADDQNYVVIHDYEIQVGRFAGRVIELAVFAMPEYPRNVASAIHVKVEPQLYEKSDSVPNVRNITDSSLGPEWRYWSHDFKWNGEKNARRLISQINTIFQNAT